LLIERSEGKKKSRCTCKFCTLNVCHNLQDLAQMSFSLSAEDLEEAT
jgi:hypothetical protein